MTFRAAPPSAAEIEPRPAPPRIALYSTVISGWTALLRILLLGGLLSSSSYAQKMSVFDGATPAGVAPGTPAGSYALSGVEHYNLFSGGFAPVLPLYHIGGRGEAGVDLVWNFQPNWAAYKQFAGASVSVSIVPTQATTYRCFERDRLGQRGRGLCPHRRHLYQLQHVLSEHTGYDRHPSGVSDGNRHGDQFDRPGDQRRGLRYQQSLLRVLVHGQWRSPPGLLQHRR